MGYELYGSLFEIVVLVGDMKERTIEGVELPECEDESLFMLKDRVMSERPVNVPGHDG